MYTTKVAEFHIASWNDDDWKNYQDSFEEFKESADFAVVRFF
jgi:hypothetical protein